MMLNSAVILLTLFSCIDGAQKQMANVLSPLSQKVVANISHGTKLKFQLKGNSGNEKVKIHLDGQSEEFIIPAEWKHFEYQLPLSGQFSVEFLNDVYQKHGVANNDVYIQGHDIYVADLLPQFRSNVAWECGTANENVRCGSLRDGVLAWSGTYTWTLKVIPGGVGFISLGKWRFGVTKDDHFSFSSGAKASIIFSSDGNVVDGQDGYHFDKSVLLSSGSDVVVGDGFLQFGNWRIGQVNEVHMSLSHSGGKTAMIWRQDGTRHPGPRPGFNCWRKQLDAANVYTGDGFVQTGVWRIGQVSDSHMSIYSTKTKKTVVIYRSDGTIHPGPRNDFQNTNAII